MFACFRCEQIVREKFSWQLIFKQQSFKILFHKQRKILIILSNFPVSGVSGRKKHKLQFTINREKKQFAVEQLLG